MNKSKVKQLPPDMRDYTEVYMAKFLLNPFDEAERLAQTRGDWVVATVDPRMSWPTKKQVVTQDGKDYVLFPFSDNESPGIAIRADQYGLDRPGARQQIMQFCSLLSWSEGAGIEILAWSGGGLPRPLHIRRGRSVVDFIDTSLLPVPTSDAGRKALALYREGMSLDNPFYAFLSLFKTISALIPVGKQRQAWIKETLPNLDNHRAIDRRDELLKNGIDDIGKYIWDKGRNAVAHAEQDPFVNPDAIDDHYRLQRDIPLLSNLAEIAIEQKAGIPRPHKVWKDHLYELEGFRKLMPEEVLTKICASEPIPAGTTVDMPDKYILTARCGPETFAFKDMVPEVVGQIEGGLVFDFVTQDGFVRIRTALDFSQERLVFDPIRGLALQSDRSSLELLEHEALLLKFQRCILGNGHLEIWDAETEKMLGRSETCIPVNCFVKHKFYESELEKLNTLIDSMRRKAKEKLKDNSNE